MHGLTSRSLLCSFAAALAGCANPADRANDAPAVESTPAKNPLALSDVAGRWKMRAENARGDSLTVYELTATSDTAGWTITFPNRPPLPLQIVAVAGDSIVTENGPYESVLRKGVQVTTRSVMRLRDGKLVGHTVARYSTGGPDSVLRLRTEATRTP